MPLITVQATIASTHPVAKYAGWRLSREALERLAEGLRTGEIPMLFDHDARETITAEFLDAGVTVLDDGEWALEAEFELDAAAWSAVQERFDNAGAPGGFSFTATVPQADPQSGGTAAVILAADAAAWTDSDRAEASALLDAIVPTRTDRLFQYSGVELATVFLILGSVGLNVLGNAAYDALKRLVSRRSGIGETRIELHRRTPQGTVSKAVVTTNDPDVVQQALDALAEEQQTETMYYDTESGVWLDG